jgi:hypothetical protein
MSGIRFARRPRGGDPGAREAVDVRAVYAEADSLGRVGLADLVKKLEALLRTRTADPLLTMEVLYQLS